MGGVLGAFRVLNGAFEGGVASGVELGDCLAEIAETRDGQEVVNRTPL